MQNRLKTIVIGAGICGVSSAIWLQRAGHEVVLLDKGAPGMGASYGNAGLLAQWAFIPVTGPHMLRMAAKYVPNPNSPLFLQWSYLPRMLPWLRQFIGHANDTDTRRIVESLIPLVGDAVDQHRALVKGSAAEKWIADSSYSFAYANRQAFENDAYGWGLRREAGLVPDIIEGPAVQEEEPILGAQTQFLAVLKGHGHIVNPGGYVAHLVEIFQQAGGRFVNAEVQDFDLGSGKIRAVDTDQGRFECDHAVVAAGIWSKPLMKKLGLKVPLEAERGYHIIYINPSQVPRNPMMIASGKFAVNPMETGLRCAGLVELGGIKAGPSKAPLALLRRRASEIFPNLRYDSTEEWLGFRPSTPDSLPLIGEIKGTGVYTAFGHQHVGLTAGPKTGRMVADMISDRRPNIDLAAYSPNRYV